MSKQNDMSIRTGDISGSGIAVGHGAQARVTITQETRAEIIQLLEELRAEIRNAAIPQETKKGLLTEVVPRMVEAAQSSDPESGLQSGLARTNDFLQAVGATTKNVSGLIETVGKIAKSVGIAFKTVAPYLWALL